MSDDNQLFKSAHAAMKFAFNFKGVPCLSVMNRMGRSTPWPGDKPRGPSMGLSGLDGAAQAGMIRSLVATLGKLHEAILIADIADRYHACGCKSLCCSGKLRNQEWFDAIGLISDVVRDAALDGHRATYPMRRACVAVYFGDKLTAVKIAADMGVTEQTVRVLLGKVRRYLYSEQERALIGADNVLDSLVIKL